MDWINDLTATLKNPFVISDGFSEPFVLKNPKVQFRWRTIFISGEITFPTFETIVDEELFNFDIDYIRPLKGGNMMLLGKPVSVKLALEGSIVYNHFDIKMTQTDFENALHKHILSSESPLLDEYNWMILTMSQQQGSKTVGHESIWNLIDYNHPDFLEQWDNLVSLAALNFEPKDNNKSMDEPKNENISPNDLGNIFEQAKEQMMDKSNPMSGMFSKMFENEGDMQEALSNSMNSMLEMFGGMSGEGDDETTDGDYESVEAVITEHLDMLELTYKMEGERIFHVTHQNNINQSVYNSVITSSDNYINVTTKYNRQILGVDFNKVYRLINGLNNQIKLGKLLVNESDGSITLRTELSAPVLYISEEPITDIIDENWTFSEETFSILDLFFEGRLTYEEAIEEAEDTFE